MFYLVSLNLLVGAAIRALVQAPRPYEYDQLLRPLADRSKVRGVVLQGCCKGVARVL